MTAPSPEEPGTGALIDDALSEIKAMGREGMGHPSTRPVLTGGAVGAVAGFILPVITWPVGLAAGAAFALWQRVRR